MALRVSAGAEASEIVGRYGERWKVRVAAAPQGGKANEAVLELLAGALGVPRKSVRLAAGSSARDKVIEVAGFTAAEADRLLASRQRKERS